MAELTLAQLDRLREVGRIATRPDATTLLVEGEAGQQFARKTMHTPFFAMRARGLFMQRLRVLVNLHHANVATVTAGYVRKNTECSTFSEFAPRGSLYDAVSSPASRLWTLPLTPPEALRLIREIANGVQALHGYGILHGGLKLSNVLLVTGQDGHLHAKVTDALLHEGFASGSLRSGTSRPTDLADPWLYLAPEQYAQRPDLASDQYALAVIAFLLLTGETPYTLDAAAHLQAREPVPLHKASSLNPILPVTVDGVLWRGMSASPKARYASPRAFADALAGVLGETNAPRVVSVAPGSIPVARGNVAPPGAIAQLHDELNLPQPLALRGEKPSMPIPGLPDLPPHYQWSDEVLSSYHPVAVPPPVKSVTTRRRAVPASVIATVIVLLMLLSLALAWMVLMHR